ncbi:MAG: YeeE/YedE family protein [Proteobacteria bacterium]|jgi:hypothetical protein|nr:YeeE/YedE family protein [Pseudomonadota bacterium]
MTEYWPWWMGALGLGGISILYLLLVGRLLGVSGSWAKVVNWKENQAIDKSKQELVQDKDAMGSAFMAETLAEFGEGAIDEFKGEVDDANINQTVPATLDAPTPWTVHLVFLLSILVGSLLTAIYTGQFEFRLDLSNVHSQIFGTTWEVWVALLTGGMMVGFGTQMAGGCTSGHGLSGCARLIPVSILATVVFMVSAIFQSMLMEVMR